jgi:uncharacterized membrane protein
MTDISRPRSKSVVSPGAALQRDSLGSIVAPDRSFREEPQLARPFPSDSDRGVYGWALAGLLSLYAVSRLSGLTHQSLWYDEGYTVALASARNFHEFWLRFGNFTTSEHLQPLYYCLIYLWSRIAGVSDAALRLPSALFSIGSVIAACIAVAHLPGGRRNLVLFSSAALAASSFSLYYAQEARPYALLQFLSFSLLAIFIRNRDVVGTRSLSLAAQISFGVVCSLCALGSPFTALLVLCLAVADLFVTRGWRLWFACWKIPASLSAASLLAYLIPALTTMPSFIARDVTAIRQPLWMNIGYTLYGIIYGTTLQPAPSLLRGPHKLHVVLDCWPVILPAAAVALALAMGTYLLIRNAKQLSSVIAIPLLACALYIFLLFGIFGAVGHLNVLPRHASALFALFFVTVTAVGSMLPMSSSKMVRSLFFLGVGGWTVLNCVSNIGYVSDPSFRKDDYRNAAALLSSYSVPEFVVAGQPQLLARYGAETHDATDVAPNDLSAFIRKSSESTPQVILIFNRFRNYRWALTDQSPVPEMAPEYNCQTAKHVANIDIYACHFGPSRMQTLQGSAKVQNPSRGRGVAFQTKIKWRMEDRKPGTTSAL